MLRTSSTGILVDVLIDDSINSTWTPLASGLLISRIGVFRG
jgi:hypothetical protein